MQTGLCVGCEPCRDLGGRPEPEGWCFVSVPVPVPVPDADS